MTIAYDVDKAVIGITKFEYKKASAAAFTEAGLIKDDGVEITTKITKVSLNAAQSITAVRHRITNIERELKVTFLELDITALQTLKQLTSGAVSTASGVTTFTDEHDLNAEDLIFQITTPGANGAIIVRKYRATLSNIGSEKLNNKEFWECELTYSIVPYDADTSLNQLENSTSTAAANS